jgi:hypothetical protein
MHRKSRLCAALLVAVVGVLSALSPASANKKEPALPDIASKVGRTRKTKPGRARRRSPLRRAVISGAFRRRQAQNGQLRKIADYQPSVNR